MKEIFICAPGERAVFSRNKDPRSIMQKRLNLTRDFYGVSINIISGRKPWKNGWQFRESDVIALLLTNRHLDPTLLSLT